MADGYSIGKAAQLAGLSPFVIRAWEKRYGVVAPDRNEGGQRRYSDREIERLRLLALLVDKGCRIGDIVNDTDEHLRSLLAEQNGPEPSDVVQTAVGVMEAFDAPGLQAVLDAALLETGPLGFIDRVVFPFMEEVGRSWHENRVKVMHEHMASAVVTALLNRILSGYQPVASAPVAVVAIPPDQVHIIGSLCCAIAAAEAGWNVVNLGMQIPPGEMVAAVRETGARLLMLSVVFPVRAAAVRQTLDTLEVQLPAGVELLVGGPSAGTFLTGTGRAEKAPRTMSGLRNRLRRS